LRAPILLRVGLLALIGSTFACSDDSVPTQPLDGGAGLTAAGENTFAICHKTGDGTYQSISVNPSAEAAHRAHGDGQVGEPVPGMGGMVFGEGCASEPESAPIEFDITNEDGTTPTPAPAGFQSQKEVFAVGDGGSARPDSLVYRVAVSNLSTTDTATNVVIRDSVAPNSNIVACREIVASVKPAVSSAAPTTCTLGDRGWEWTVGDLPPSSQVELYFRAEALDLGADVNRVRVTYDQLPAPEIVDDEATTVAP
jgi:uncharacterized repeat protein (TIGR01451 family)